jgi:hypothetical protein
LLGSFEGCLPLLDHFLVLRFLGLRELCLTFRLMYKRPSLVLRLHTLLVALPELKECRDLIEQTSASYGRSELVQRVRDDWKHTLLCLDNHTRQELERRTKGVSRIPQDEEGTETMATINAAEPSLVGVGCFHLPNTVGIINPSSALNGGILPKKLVISYTVIIWL